MQSSSFKVVFKVEVRLTSFVTSFLSVLPYIFHSPFPSLLLFLAFKASQPHMFLLHSVLLSTGSLYLHFICGFLDGLLIPGGETSLVAQAERQITEVTQVRQVTADGA